MEKLDTIIAVKDVEASAKWYQSIFDCKGMHGGDEFEILTLQDGQVFLCLHKWGAHEHPPMMKTGNTIGNGMILYFRTNNMNEIRERLKKIDYKVENEMALNPNSGQMEFSFQDLDGYYITVSQHHNYGI